VTDEPQRDTRATRRGVLAGVGLAGLAGAISACSSGGSSSSSGGTGSDAGAGAAPAATSASGGGSALGSTNQIPVGGGTVFSSDKVVVTQPTPCDFKGFSAVCTHMQCTVGQVAGGTIDCPCHGSKFSVKDGSVVSGPAPSPLPAQTIKVTGTNIFLG
jgi:nitrite reductase/ring-hydroxylating ferredoxin subunit